MTHIWYVQTLATQSFHFQTFATEKLRRGFREQGGYGATQWLRKRLDWRDQFWPIPDFPDHHGDGAILKKFFRAFSTEVETARLSRMKWGRRDFPGRGGDGATNNHFIATVVEEAQLSRSEWRPCKFAD